MLSIGCAHTSLPHQGTASPLVFDQAEVDAADTIAVFVPGALASVEIFDPVKTWKESGYALVYYRFPGLDGLPLDHTLSIEHAAAEIAELANRHPGKAIRLLGYSTGGPIAILASEQIRSEDVKVALISPAPPKAGGMRTALRSTRDVMAASIRAGSMNRRKVWMEYYRTLLYGRAGLKDPELADDIARIVEEEKDNIVIPESDISRAHTRDIRKWQLQDGLVVDSRRVVFYIGMEDPVFSVRQLEDFAQTIGVSNITRYPDAGHLLFKTHPEVFDDIYTFFGE